MALAPTSSRGGGGLSWPGLTLDADGNAVLAPADALAALSQFHIVAPANSNDAWSVTDSAHPAQILGAVDPFGYFSGTGAGFSATSDTRILDLSTNGALTTKDAIRLTDAAATLLRVNFNGYLITKKNAAPADAELNANECAVWFDKTNGAAKFMFKGKTADGTVVSASVVMA